jgi:hypothetical protein
MRPNHPHLGQTKAIVLAMNSPRQMVNMPVGARQTDNFSATAPHKSLLLRRHSLPNLNELNDLAIRKTTGFEAMQPEPEIRPVLSEPRALRSPLRRTHLSTWGTAIITFGLIIFTFYFAYNCSLIVPASPNLIFSDPSTTILILAILPQIAVFLLSQLTSQLTDIVRLAFAASTRGIVGLTFFTLDPATTEIDLLKVLWKGFSNMRWRDYWRDPLQRLNPSMDNPAFWSFQRYRSLTHMLDINVVLQGYFTVLALRS